MKAQTLKKNLSPLTLYGETASDLMTPNPVSISMIATLKEAVAFLTDKGFSAAPVIDRAGKPVGVISQSDIVIHDRESVKYASSNREPCSEHIAPEDLERELRTGFEVVDVDRTRVRDIMTPIVFSVSPETPAHKVVAEMLAHKVHRVFVVDEAGTLTGVISAFDILRHLRMGKPSKN